MLVMSRAARDSFRVAGNRLGNELDGRDLGHEGGPEVAVEDDLAQEVQVLDDDRPIQPHLVLEQGNVLGFGLGRKEEQGWISVKEKKEEGDGRDGQTDPHCFDELAENIGSHPRWSPFPVRRC